MNALAFPERSQSITERRQPRSLRGTGAMIAGSVSDVLKSIRASNSVSQSSPKSVVEAVLDDGNALAAALRESRSSFKILVSRVSMHLGVAWLEKLFAQIDSLLDVDEWDTSDPVPKIETARTFIRMLLAMKVARKPGLGISNSGNLVAAWTNGSNRLTVECMPHDRVRWVLARVVDGEVERAAGDGKIERLKDILAPYEPTVWFEYAE
jgi:hypothetical protein